MDSYEMRYHIDSIVVTLREILEEIKAMRKEYAEGQVAYVIDECPSSFYVSCDEYLNGGKAV